MLTMGETDGVAPEKMDASINKKENASIQPNPALICQGLWFGAPSKNNLAVSAGDSTGTCKRYFTSAEPSDVRKIYDLLHIRRLSRKCNRLWILLRAVPPSIRL